MQNSTAKYQEAEPTETTKNPNLEPRKSAVCSASENPTPFCSESHPRLVGSSHSEPVGGARQQITHNALCVQAIKHLSDLRIVPWGGHLNTEEQNFVLHSTHRSFWNTTYDPVNP